MPPFPGREEYRQMMTVHSTRNGVPPEGYTATGAPEPFPAGEPIPVAEPAEPAVEEHVPEEEHVPTEEPEPEEDPPQAAKRNHHRKR